MGIGASHRNIANYHHNVLLRNINEFGVVRLEKALRRSPSQVDLLPFEQKNNFNNQRILMLMDQIRSPKPKENVLGDNAAARYGGLPERLSH